MLLLALLLPLAHAETVAYASLSGAMGFLLENVGDFALGAEHTFGEHHGLLVEGTLIHVHGDPTHATTYGGQLGYRYHVGDAFVGVVGGYEVGGAKYFTAEHGGPYLHYALKHLSVVPHVGYRWHLGQHAAITARFGAGYGTWTVSPDEPGHDAETQLLADRLQFTPVKLDSELSVGFVF